MQEQILINCTYFKESGKYYCDGKGVFDKKDFDDCIYPREYGQKLNNMGKLPGLQSGVWKDYFTIMVENKYEELVIC